MCAFNYCCSMLRSQLTDDLVIASSIMSNVSLPIEVLEAIIKEFVSEQSEQTKAKERSSVTRVNLYLPRSYLTPLLRVCKLWNPLAEKHLYRSISVGSRFCQPHTFIDCENLVKRRARIAAIPGRKGHEIVGDLLKTLSRDPRLAELVKELQLGIEDDGSISTSAWTLANSQLLVICPNVQHVDITGFCPSALPFLTIPLKRRPLVSFSISTSNLSSATFNAEYLSEIFNLMQGWPRLRSIIAHGFLKETKEKIAPTGSKCPELETIILNAPGYGLDHTSLKVFRAMCTNVKTLSVPISKTQMAEEAELDVLCDCLHIWSPTLEYLRMDICSYAPSYRPLSEALSLLVGLRELQVNNSDLDFEYISHLPRLERLLCSSNFDAERMKALAALLDNPNNFPSLKCTVVRDQNQIDLDPRLKDVCLRRNIQLMGYSNPFKFFPGPVPGFFL